MKMSKKNLARTAIEGGRTGSNKWDRHYSHKETRAQERAFLGEVQSDLENYYEYDIEETRHVYKEFNDKLGPMYRWLQSQCGRPWNDVRSEVTKTFDTRTTAGRHIVYDHLLSSVEEGPDYNYRRYYYGPEDYTTSYHRYDFYVDNEGVLREKTVVKRRGGYYDRPPAFDTSQIANWLSGRCVGQVGNKFFWFVPADKNKKRGGASHTWRTTWGNRRYYHGYGLNFSYLSKEPIYKKDSVGQYIYQNGTLVTIGYQEKWNDSTPIFRQDRKLNPKEMAFWNTIPTYYQTKVLERSPVYPNPPKPDYGYYW
jgi:hypothetical protein